VDWEHAYAGFEVLIVSEMSLDRLWAFLDELRTSGDNGNFMIPAVRPTDPDLKKLARSALESSKGAGWAKRLFEGSTVVELPTTVTSFLEQVYAAFPKPADIPVKVMAAAAPIKPAEAAAVGPVVTPAAGALPKGGPMEVCGLRQQLLDCKGHALVIGGPGSGKTTIALKKSVVRIADGLSAGQSVLFLSFSRAAVARVGEAARVEVPKTQRGMLSMSL
jgi:hypothetical protein